MKFVIIPDIHFVEDNDNHKAILSELFPKLREYGEYAIFLGDIQHYKRNALNYNQYQIYSDLFNSITIPYFGVSGNHDYVLGTNSKSWFPIITQGRITDTIITKEIAGTTFVLVPYTTQLDGDAFINSLPDGDVLITHFSIQPYFEQFGSDEGLTRNDIDKLKERYKIVISGHIHEKYIYDNFWYYCGYVLSSNFAYKPNQQYICIFDSSDYSLDYIPLDSIIFGVSIVKYYTLTYQEFIERQEQILNDDNNYYLITTTDYALYKSLVSEFYQYPHITFKIKFGKQKHYSKYTIQSETTQSLFSNYISILKQYTKKELDKKGIKDKKLRKKIYSLGKKLIEKTLKDKEVLSEA